MMKRYIDCNGVRGARWAVRVEQAGGLRFGGVLWDILERLSRHEVRPKRFGVLHAARGTIVLEWLFAREEEARTFAAAIAAETHAGTPLVRTLHAAAGATAVPGGVEGTCAHAAGNRHAGRHT